MLFPAHPQNHLKLETNLLETAMSILWLTELTKLLSSRQASQAVSVLCLLSLELALELELEKIATE